MLIRISTHPFSSYQALIPSSIGLIHPFVVMVIVEGSIPDGNHYLFLFLIIIIILSLGSIAFPSNNKII